MFGFIQRLFSFLVSLTVATIRQGYACCCSTASSDDAMLMTAVMMWLHKPSCRFLMGAGNTLRWLERKSSCGERPILKTPHCSMMATATV